MQIGTIVIIIFLSYELEYLFNILFSKNTRQGTIITNKRLDELRLIQNKTIEEQKEFIDLAYPKQTQKFKMSWKVVGMFLFYMIKFIVLFFVLSRILMYFNIEISLLQAICIIMVAPLLLGLLLKKFGMNRHEPLVHLWNSIPGLFKLIFTKKK